MVLLVVSGALDWKIPLAPVIMLAVLVYGPCTFTELCRVNELVLSKPFEVVKAKTALVPPTKDTLDMLG